RLARFREAFTSRYEGREVPLTEALDEDTGIGFEPSTAPGAEASPLLQELDFSKAPPEPEFIADNQYRHLFVKLEEALRTGAHEIVLDERDIAQMESKRENDDE